MARHSDLKIQALTSPRPQARSDYENVTKVKSCLPRRKFRVRLIYKSMRNDNQTSIAGKEAVDIDSFEEISESNLSLDKAKRNEIESFLDDIIEDLIVGIRFSKYLSSVKPQTNNQMKQNTHVQKTMKKHQKRSFPLELKKSLRQQQNTILHGIKDQVEKRAGNEGRSAKLGESNEELRKSSIGSSSDYVGDLQNVVSYDTDSSSSATLEGRGDLIQELKVKEQTNKKEHNSDDKKSGFTDLEDLPRHETTSQPPPTNVESNISPEFVKQQIPSSKTNEKTRRQMKPSKPANALVPKEIWPQHISIQDPLEQNHYNVSSYSLSQISQTKQPKVSRINEDVAQEVHSSKSIKQFDNQRLAISKCEGKYKKNQTYKNISPQVASQQAKGNVEETAAKVTIQSNVDCLVPSQLEQENEIRSKEQKILSRFKAAKNCVTSQTIKKVSRQIRDPYFDENANSRIVKDIMMATYPARQENLMKRRGRSGVVKEDVGQARSERQTLNNNFDPPTDSNIMKEDERKVRTPAPLVNIEFDQHDDPSCANKDKPHSIIQKSSDSCRKTSHKLSISIPSKAGTCEGHILSKQDYTCGQYLSINSQKYPQDEETINETEGQNKSTECINSPDEEIMCYDQVHSVDDLSFDDLLISSSYIHDFMERKSDTAKQNLQQSKAKALPSSDFENEGDDSSDDWVEIPSERNPLFRFKDIFNRKYHAILGQDDVGPEYIEEFFEKSDGWAPCISYIRDRNVKPDHHTFEVRFKEDKTVDVFDEFHMTAFRRASTRLPSAISRMLCQRAQGKNKTSTTSRTKSLQGERHFCVPTLNSIQRTTPIHDVQIAIKAGLRDMRSEAKLLENKRHNYNRDRFS